MQVYNKYIPIVSIIMPTFNREKYLQRSISSVLEQSFEDWELIVVDDGSTDNSFDIINNYMNSVEKIRYIKHTNRRPPLSFNAGILAACGQYVTFLNSDDEYKTDHLDKRFEFLNIHPEIDLIHGGIEVIGHPYVKDKNDLTKEIHISECTVGGTFFGKRHMFIELNGFRNLKYSDDSDFIERAGKKFIIQKINATRSLYCL